MFRSWAKKNARSKPQALHSAQPQWRARADRSIRESEIDRGGRPSCSCARGLVAVAADDEGGHACVQKTRRAIHFSFPFLASPGRASVGARALLAHRLAGRASRRVRKSQGNDERGKRLAYCSSSSLGSSVALFLLEKETWLAAPV